MMRGVLCGAVAGLVAVAPPAASQQRKPGCAAPAQQIAASSGLAFVRHSSSVMFYTTTNAEIAVTLNCGFTSEEQSIVVKASATHDDRRITSPDQLIDIIARTGTLITSDDPAEITRLAKRCIAKARKDRDELFQVVGGKSTVSCSLFKGRLGLIDVGQRREADGEE